MNYYIPLAAVVIELLCRCIRTIGKAIKESGEWRSYLQGKIVSKPGTQPVSLGDVAVADGFP